MKLIFNGEAKKAKILLKIIPIRFVYINTVANIKLYEIIEPQLSFVRFFLIIS